MFVLAVASFFVFQVHVCYVVSLFPIVNQLPERLGFEMIIIIIIIFVYLNMTERMP